MPLKKTRLRRELRHNPTPAEKVFWAMINDRKLLGLKFRRQHSVGVYIVDFYCPAEKLVIEIDGDTHATTEGIQKDKIRTGYLEALGYKIIRYSNLEVLDNLEGVFQDLSNKISSMTLTQPLPKGRGEMFP